MKEYNKIQTIFKRDERNVIIPGDFTLPEFSTLKDLKWDCTEKVDGTNMSVHIIPKPYITGDGILDCETGYEYDVEYHGKTANAHIPPHLLKKMQELFPKDKLIEYFTRDGKEITESIILYGEGYGMKIQNGGNYIKDDCSFILFDVRVGDWWLERPALEEIATGLGIQIVTDMGKKTIKEACEFVLNGFKSTVAKSNPDYLAEGLVLKAPHGILLRNGKRLMTKIKYKDFQDYMRRYPDRDLKGMIENI